MQPTWHYEHLTSPMHAAQVLGLTNYSRWQDAGAVRACLADSPALGQKLLPLALASLRKFAHVGCTEQLVASIQSLAATMGMHLDGPAWEVGPHAFASTSFVLVGCMHGAAGGIIQPTAATVGITLDGPA